MLKFFFSRQEPPGQFSSCLVATFFGVASGLCLSTAGLREKITLPLARWEVRGC